MYAIRNNSTFLGLFRVVPQDSSEFQDVDDPAPTQRNHIKGGHQTDIATTRPNWPSGPIWWKSFDLAYISRHQTSDIFFLFLKFEVIQIFSKVNYSTLTFVSADCWWCGRAGWHFFTLVDPPSLHRLSGKVGLDITTTKTIVTESIWLDFLTSRIWYFRQFHQFGGTFYLFWQGKPYHRRTQIWGEIYYQSWHTHFGSHKGLTRYMYSP